MIVRWAGLGSVAALTGAIALMVPSLALAQTKATTTLTAPDYGSGVSAGGMSDSNFNTPESDGRPGVKFFTLAVQAFRKGDFRHALDMYKVAASWAYKPAEYNLGIMYFKGQGTPVDRARGTAWMILAAERGNPTYAHARDLMVTALTNAQFKRTDEIWNTLKRTYGDKVALRRAKAQWTWVKNHQTGTRVGGAVGELRVGVLDGGHTPVSLNAGGKPVQTATTAFSLLQGGSVDSSVAYRQLQQSDNPYDPVFLKNRSGTVSVEPLQPVQPTHGKVKKHKQSADGSSQPSQLPRNA